MIVSIYRNGKRVKRFKKWFTYLVDDPRAWAKEKFPKAKEIIVDMKFKNIIIFYEY